MYKILGLKLNVGYREKEEAKLAGAKWDFSSKTWYLPLDESTKKVLKWINPEYLVKVKSKEQEQVEDNSKIYKSDVETEYVIRNLETGQRMKPNDFFNKDINKYYFQIREGYPCFKCNTKMNIIAAFYDKPNIENNTESHEYALIWNKPQSFVRFAKQFNIKMKYSSTSLIKEPYALHSCPKCGKIQGDFYMFDEHDCTLNVLESFWGYHDVENDIWYKL